MRRRIAELELLARAVELLAWHAEPQLGTSTLGDRVSGSRERPIGDPSTEHFRKKLDSARKRIGGLATELVAFCEGRDIRPERWRCVDCGRFQREGARFCDTCGRRRDTAA